MSDFDFELKKRRPFWKDSLIFAGTVLGVWAGTHLALNYEAFAQIAQFKAKKLQASVVEMFESKEVIEVSSEEVVESPLDFIELKKVDRRTNLYKTKKLKPKRQVKSLLNDMDVLPSDNRIYIPRIAKNVPLVEVPAHKNWVQLEGNIQKGLRDGVVVHPTSHDPGTVGNFFATGHSSFYKWDPGRFKDVFALLHEVEVGDKVEVYWEGQKFTYKIKEEKVVAPTEISVLNHPENKTIITLMTCTPIGSNTSRLILVGELVE